MADPALAPPRASPGAPVVVPNGAESRRLAEVVSAATYGDLPALVVGDAERAVLDWLGCTLAGAIEPPARMAQRIAAGLGASSDATVFGAGRASAAAAALANGVAAHILELDDVHKGSTMHAAAPVISAAVAVAEREHASGEAFLLAVTVGYEAALRVGDAVNPSHYRFWHPTGTAATFGAAAAAGSLLGLGAGPMLDALGTAGTQAAGLWEFNADGAMSKCLHPGKAAMNGILAADLARLGFTGATRILEGDRGFFRATSASYDPARVTADLPVGGGAANAWKISENCYKLHSCCGHTHTAIDAALDLRAKRGWSRDVVLRDVAEVRIDTYGTGYEIVKEDNPRTPYQAKFSMGYVVAAALLEGNVGLDQFSPNRFGEAGVEHEPIRALLARTHVRVADDLSARYPAAWPTRLTIVLTDGSELRGAGDYPRGNPENPVSTETLEAKFIALVSGRRGEDLAHHALHAVRSIGQCRDMSELFPGL